MRKIIPLYKAGRVYDSNYNHIATLTRDIYEGEVMSPEDITFANGYVPKPGEEIDRELMEYIISQLEKGLV